jgi:MoxR-like ATPase
MLPSDVVGVTIYNAHTQDFEFKQGPIFTNFLLADEINRATPKTQSALLEAMNELQVTVDGRSYPLAQPFMVIATQNPVEHHGTYPLPESQLDRFLMRIRIGYPDQIAEREIVRQGTPQADAVRPVITGEELVALQESVARVSVDETLVDYMLAIVQQTRKSEALSMGVSPRGAQALFRASQALAAVDGRDYVTPDDIKHLAVPVGVRASGCCEHTDDAQPALGRSRGAGNRGDPDARRSAAVISTIIEVNPLTNENCNYRSAHGRQDQSIHHPHRRP